MYKNELSKAYEDFTQAITIDPENYKALLYRASLYPNFGTMEQALEDAKKVSENSTDPELKQQAQQMLTAIPTLPTLTPGPSPMPLPSPTPAP
jgi:Tfp pilus assembly protein PilF